MSSIATFCQMDNRDKSFATYKENGYTWITLAGGEYYPDILEDACNLYQPVIVLFGQLLRRSEASTSLFIKISEIPNAWMRTQLASTAWHK